MKSIWKTRKKFEIQMVGQNLFLISFELADDLELILEGRPWFFRNNVILFDRLCQAVDRDQIRLTSSPYWMKIDSISPKFDKKDLMHAIGATFGGILRSEINEDSCRLRVNFDVQRPLRRGIFVSTSAVSKVWVPFKYENLPMFCFGCGRLGHGLSNCTQLTHERISKINENPPYSLALKAESKLFGKESIKFNAWIKKECGELLGGEEMNREEEGLMRLKKDEESKVCPRKQCHIKYEDNANWKRTQSAGKIMKAVGEANMRKRKFSDVDLTRGHKENVDRVKFKRLKQDNLGE
ncbi:hypothetical protein Gotri_004690 [Gossypium trilobum]|uniref:CCHC-type domain-containing protein n=1 Tax=Gossypium trilobum TaxID=34281 RepID=A0A7J9F5L9_9ROSI|nr:hypothetical protein [Gossypium trilobum]